MTKYVLYMIACIQNVEDSLTSKTHKISGTSDEENWENELLEEVANYLVYTSDEKIKDLLEFMKNRNRNMNVQICKENDWYPYEINIKLLMKIYNKKYDEYHVESEYDITDWAISSSEEEEEDGISI